MALLRPRGFTPSTDYARRIVCYLVDSSGKRVEKALDARAVRICSVLDCDDLPLDLLEVEPASDPHPPTVTVVPDRHILRRLLRIVLEPERIPREQEDAWVAEIAGWVSSEIAACQ
jgi:hypothetical protein